MRESIEESNVMMLVVAIVFIFVSFMCLMVSFSKTIKQKNEVISIIEKYNGFDNANIESSTTGTIISNYLKAANYTSRWRSPGENFRGADCVDVAGEKHCSYWIRENSIPNSYLVNYDVVLFYKFNLPIIKNFASFTVKGETIDLKVKTKLNYHIDS